MFDHGIREFESPLAPSPSENPAVAPPEPVVAMMSRCNDEHDRDITIVIKAMTSDPLFAAAVVALAVLTDEERAKAVAAWDFWWDDLTPQDRAKVVESFRPGLTAAEVARRSGAGERSIYRWRQERGHDPASRPRQARGFKDREGHLDAWDSFEEDSPGWQS